MFIAQFEMTVKERVETSPFILEVNFVPTWKHVSLEIRSKQKITLKTRNITLPSYDSI